MKRVIYQDMPYFGDVRRIWVKIPNMPMDVSKLPPTVRRIVKNEDSILGFFVIWFLGLTIFPLGAFYFGTIASPESNAYGVNHYWDLRVADMHVGGWYALGGLAIGIAWGLWATFIYPKIKEADAAEDAETSERIHDLVSHHEEISTPVGQQADHGADK